MKKNILKKVIIILIFLLISFIWLGIAYALNTYTTGYKIFEANDNSGKNYEIIDDLPESYEWKDVCIKITNYMDNAWTTWFFNPTKTKTEWDSFKSWCDINLNNNTVDNNSNCKIQKKQPEEIFHIIDTWWGPAWDPHDENHSCWINDNWYIKCWWADNEGQSSIPNDIKNEKAKAVYLWFQFSMSIMQDWTLHWWWKDYGWTISSIPSIFTDSNADVKNLAIWAYNACALNSDNNNEVYCWWGFSEQYCIQNNDNWVNHVPFWFRNWIKFIDTWDYSACVIKHNWDLKCWWEDDGNCNKDGSNRNYGQYAINNDNNWNKNMKKVAVWKEFSCWLRSDWKIKCFSDNNEYKNIPNGFNQDIVDIQAGPRNICALKKDGQIWCWWDSQSDRYWINTYETYKVKNSDYEIDSSADNSNNAKNHRKNNNKSFGMWFYHICVIKTNNSTECWWLHSPKSSNSNNDNFIPSNFIPHSWVNTLCDENLFK